MSTKSVSNTSSHPESAESVDLSTKKESRSAKPPAAHQRRQEYRSGVAEALEMGKTSMDIAVCMSCCALDIYRSAWCFAPQLTGYFELGSRVLASYAELQSSCFGLLMPQAEAMSNPDWLAQSCEPEEMLERSMDIALGAFNAQMSFLREVSEASVSYDAMRGTFGEIPQPA